MAWRIELETRARKELARIDPPEARRIRTYLRDRVASRDDPSSLAAPLAGQWRDYWRFRVGDYRLICHLDETTLTVLVVRIGHRRQVYQ